MINEQYFQEFPQLKTQRLFLRKQELKDAASLQQLRSNDAVMKFMDSDKHLDTKTSEAFIGRNLETYEKKSGFFWVITERESGNFMGDIILHKIDRTNARAEIGYTLHPDYWGHGYMKEAMRAVISFGFNDLALHSIEANINPANDTSRALLLKMGFIKEAYFRENYYYNGKFLDSEIYSLLEKDFLRK
ncbi:GNAT family N-acetyltransferase [Salinimicrobium sediminilitoris]|uniref:GNAT family N-acetyltransferase n=1 Tax=Salinimicrobium sediminilitoris TaxID=2876715 RepID=UPI001E5602C6|nr:GNAT family N-acetyltransferase [Salinimicrobium sediminilitoris]MCC8361110.1 GNAT family N-acetyltransferase [Salinimicrobium sediminilitoris]